MFDFKTTLLISVIALTACGGGGGSGGGESTPPVTTSPGETDNGSGGENGNGGTTPTLPSEPLASYTTGGSLSGYTYTTPDGNEYTMRGNGISVGGVFIQMLTRVDGTQVSATSWCCGKMSYTTYGTWTHFEKGTHDVFYTGDATLAANVPTQGTATYSGSGMRDSTRSDATFNVDFGAKTIAGSIAAGDDYGSAVAMQGKISNGGFSGDAQSGGQNGNFIGHFNGPGAEELGGIAQFNDSTKNTSFGATRQ